MSRTKKAVCTLYAAQLANKLHLKSLSVSVRAQDMLAVLLNLLSKRDLSLPGDGKSSPP